MLPIEKRLFALCERFLNATNDDVRNLATAFFVHHQHFFTFVHEEGIDLIDNARARASNGRAVENKHVRLAK